MNDVLRLQEPLKEGAIRSVNFFNGRLLTSKDLTREQQARREADWRNGLALGDGVAFGLDVSPDSTPGSAPSSVVRVSAGLAVNRRGQSLRLTSDTSVALTRSMQSVAPSCLFANCAPIGGGTYVAGAGIYVLTIAPAEISEGRAQTNGLDASNVRCNTDATLEATQFRLLSVSPTLYPSLDIGASSFRNALAYRCFGNDVGTHPIANLLADSPRREGLLESLRPYALTDFDVPLALIYMRGSATIAFIDCWAVRRGLSRGESGGLHGLIEPHRLAVGEAMFMQFQRHIADLVAPAGSLGAASARTHFQFLPPVGLIPVTQSAAGTAGQAAFFSGMTVRGPAFMNAARLDDLVRESVSYPPIETQGKEVLWLYAVRENRMQGDFGSVAPRPRAYLVFASGHLPYRADAQFDLAYWNYSNFALA
jgi:hypothetical protein